MRTLSLYLLASEGLKCWFVLLSFHNEMVWVDYVRLDVEVVEGRVSEDAVKSVMGCDECLKGSLKHQCPCPKVGEALHHLVVQTLHWFSPGCWEWPHKWHDFLCWEGSHKSIRWDSRIHFSCIFLPSQTSFNPSQSHLYSKRLHNNMENFIWLDSISIFTHTHG